MKKLNLKKIGVICFIGLSVTSPMIATVINHNHVIERETVVTHKERVTNKDESKYLVYTDNGTFEVTDSLMMFRWDSSDVYGEIKTSECYNIRTRGFRIPFLSVYPNIESTTACK